MLVLGLQAPAFAANPTITSFTPGSGPTDCVIVVTGTGFTNPDVDEVLINAAAADFEVQSDTEIWVEANGAGDGFIEVSNVLDESDSSAPTVFQDTTLDTDPAGDCAPTVTLFSPTCGLVGTPVTITGTNLIQPGAVASTFEGGMVEFSPFAALTGDGVEASHTGAPEDPTTLVVTVPPSAETGRIRVTTAVDSVLSTDSFTVVTDLNDCPDVVGDEHARTITLKLRKHLIAKGRITVADEFTECAASVPVKIQRKKPGGGWKTVKLTTTSSTGKYAKKIKDRPGKYRAKATKVTLESGDVCLKDVSPRVKHRH
jgi:hypothetical protein